MPAMMKHKIIEILLLVFDGAVFAVENISTQIILRQSIEFCFLSHILRSSFVVRNLLLCIVGALLSNYKMPTNVSVCPMKK